MNDFFGKMKEDSRFNALVKLAGYSIIVVVAIIFILVSPNNTVFTGNSDDAVKTILKLPEKYQYTFTINKDDKVVSYKGDYNNSEIIKKESDIETVYKIVDNNYYLSSGDDLKKISVDEVYDVVPYDYVNVDWINKLVNLSKEKDDILIVYIKDIVTDSNTEEYITMNVGSNELSVDYTNLMKITDENINNCTLVFEYSGKE